LVPQGILAWVRPVETHFSAFIQNHNPGTAALDDFGPKAPKGLEANWIPTSGKKPYAMFRFYGPEEAFYNKTFKLANVELVR
jgi:hypothetical protein